MAVAALPNNRVQQGPEVEREVVAGEAEVGGSRREAVDARRLLDRLGLAGQRLAPLLRLQRAAEANLVNVVVRPGVR